MKKKLCNQNGSTLVMLVIAIGIISMLGTSILGVTMMNYKIKKTNTDIKEAFYLSESGLDKTYANAYDYVQEAVQESNELAKEFISEFKLENIEFLSKTHPYYLCVIEIPIYDENNIKVGSNYEFNEEQIQKQAEIIFNSNFKSYIDNNISSLVSSSNPVITINNLGWEYDSLNLYKELKLKVNSKYTNKDNIKKTTSVNLSIEVPKYNEPYLVSTKVIPVNPFLTKVVSGNNLTFSGNSEFNGHVYMTGNLISNTPSASSLFKGELSVKEDIKLDGNNSTLKSRDIYAKNILLNGSNVVLETTNEGNKVYVKDDLEINSSNQKVTINGSYYGFSDGTNSSGPDNSSGININEHSGLSLTITDDLYLYGTSYVNINDSLKYQTGESISIRGNYLAYTQPLLDAAMTSEGRDLRDVEFQDYDYLTFVERFKNGSKLTAMDKAAYIKYYNLEYNDLTKPSNIDININKVHSIGSTIDKGAFVDAKYIVDDNAIFKEAETKFNNQINQLGFINDYENKPIGNILFANEIKLNNIPNTIENSSNKEKFIYINKGTGTYTLSSGKYSGLIITNENINISNDVDFNGLIVTTGNINILGKFNLNGSIIAKGNITLAEAGVKTFNHNLSIVSNIIAEYDLHKSLFKDAKIVDTNTVTSFVINDEISDETINVDFSRLLKLSNWQVE